MQTQIRLQITSRANTCILLKFEKKNEKYHRTMYPIYHDLVSTFHVAGVFTAALAAVLISF